MVIGSKSNSSNSHVNFDFFTLMVDEFNDHRYEKSKYAREFKPSDLNQTTIDMMTSWMHLVID